ncbi:hypothetical protein, partial [Pseudomonas syringae]|uniref:hypothetical protein n=1 Tax=Pseudomonas syringae TaxID=317 RepID=UPI001F29B2C4
MPLTSMPTLCVGMQLVTLRVAQRFCDASGICFRLNAPFRSSASHFEVSKARSSVFGTKIFNKKGSTFRLTLFLPPSRADLFGRRDWTRTNDPHHVKVVL